MRAVYPHLFEEPR